MGRMMLAFATGLTMVAVAGFQVQLPEGKLVGLPLSR